MPHCVPKAQALHGSRRWVGLGLVALALVTASPAAARAGGGRRGRQAAVQADSGAGHRGAQVLLATRKRSRTGLGHSVVGVRLPGEKPVWFDQRITSAGRLSTWSVIRGGKPASFDRRYPGWQPPQATYKVLALPVPRARAEQMLSAARHRVTRGNQPYSILSNNCTTNCRAVLEAGGLKPGWWARSPKLLKMWMRAKGARPPGRAGPPAGAKPAGSGIAPTAAVGH